MHRKLNVRFYKYFIHYGEKNDDDENGTNQQTQQHKNNNIHMIKNNNKTLLNSHCKEKIKFEHNVDS